MKFGRFCLWLVIFALLLLAADQAMVHLPAGEGAAGESRQLYLDFRQGLLQSESEGESEALPSAPPRYVYVDDDGDLHFADSLPEVPSRFRGEAQLLER